MRWPRSTAACRALQDGFRLLAHDERADTGVEHIGLVHRLNRPSSLTTSSRSAIKSGSAFSNWRTSPGRPDGTQNNAVPFPDDLQLAHSLKIQIAGQTNGAVIAVFKNGYSSHHFLWPTGLYDYVQYMQMQSICIVIAYADGKYMRMPHLCRCPAYGYVEPMLYSLFSRSDPKKVVPDLIQPPAGAQRPGNTRCSGVSSCQ